MKKIRSILRKVFKGILVGLLLLLIIELLIYFQTPVYDFPPPAPFTGNQWYNPYNGMDSTRWRKANFHFHTRAWGGLTSGRYNTHEAFYQTYKTLGYDAPQIANYQNIDTYFADSAFYIPSYEHGFGVRKKHQLLIGSKGVMWFDYSLYQNLHNKQHILNLLRNDNEIVAIAHPDWENGYPLKHMFYLSNYDLLEVLDNNWRSIPQWDAALSTGHPVFILADDDAHDVSNPYEIHRCVTYINTHVLNRDGMIRSLKEGNAFGVEVYMSTGETFEQKALNARLIPTLNSVTVRGDTLRISVTEKALKFTFIGQDGQIRKITRLASAAWYKFCPEDTYIRTEITFLKKFMFPKVGPGTIFYLNPIFRYDGKPPSNGLRAEVNLPRTWIYRILGYGSLAALLSLFIYIRLRKRITRN